MMTFSGEELWLAVDCDSVVVEITKSLPLDERDLRNLHLNMMRSVRQVLHEKDALELVELELFKKLVAVTKRYSREAKSPNIQPNTHTQGSALRTIQAARVPTGAEKLLWFCLPRGDSEVVLGDLEEDYRRRLPKLGPTLGYCWYWKEAIRTVWPFTWARIQKIVGILLLGRLADWLRRFGS